MIKRYKQLFRALSICKIGNIIVTTPEGAELKFEGTEPGPICDIQIQDWSAIDIMVKRGDIGLGESYFNDLWHTKDLPALLSYCAANIDHLKSYAYSNTFPNLVLYLYNRLIKANTKKGSKDNIKAHYDISNDFYKLWLDPSMTYSSALYQDEAQTLEEAQTKKYQRILDILAPKDAEILEIGCGWGGFAEKALEYGAKVTGITISKNQYEFAKNRLQDKAEIIFEDYRNIKKQYDHIVSIEMFEAVGEKYWSTYFNKIKESLSENGKAIIQTITIKDEIFDKYRKEVDYIRHYVFPGGMLPSKQRFCEEATKSGLKIKTIFEFGADYALTLREWLKKFYSIHDDLKEMGYTTQFLKAWEFYLSISIAGFEVGRTNVMQVEMTN